MIFVDGSCAGYTDRKAAAGPPTALRSRTEGARPRPLRLPSNEKTL